MIPYYVPTEPDFEKLTTYLREVHDRQWFTNFGPLSEQLGRDLGSYLQHEHLLPVSNCTQGLMAAYQLFGCKRVVTTPYSFVATAASLKWMRIKMHFVDIDPYTQNICPDALDTFLANQEFKIDAIVATHVYGNPCDVDRIQAIAEKYDVRVIYDAAHAFDVRVNGRSVLEYGDCSVLSFHATKIFHSVEGGAMALGDLKTLEHARKIINFGIDRDGVIGLVGINAKLSEYHAAAGLAQLPVFNDVKSQRVNLYKRYNQHFNGKIQLQQWHSNSSPNGAYMPVFFESQQQRDRVINELDKVGIGYKLYFAKNLNCTLFAEKDQSETPVAEHFCRTVLCLPIYQELTLAEVDHIATTVLQVLK